VQRVLTVCCHFTIFSTSVAEPHHFHGAPAPGKNFDAAQAPTAPAPTLIKSNPPFIQNKQKVIRRVVSHFLLIFYD
jgi:hypothetical protein